MVVSKNFQALLGKLLGSPDNEGHTGLASIWGMSGSLYMKIGTP